MILPRYLFTLFAAVTLTAMLSPHVIASNNAAALNTATNNDDNLLLNAELTQPRSKTEPAQNWLFEGWQLNLNTSSVAILRENDTPIIQIQHQKPAHSHLGQRHVLSANKIYLFSAEAKASVSNSNLYGASIAVGSEYASGCNIKTDKTWSLCELYIDNKVEQNNVNLILSLGFYSSLNQGQAQFRNISLREVSAIPHGKQALELSKAIAAQKIADKKLKPYYFVPPKNAGRIGLLLSLIFGLSILIFILVRSDKSELTTDEK